MHLLFDLDGTLTDSRPGIITSIQFALTESGLQVPAAENLLWCIGPPILESFRTLVGPESPDLFEPTVHKYRERYGDTGLFESQLYPGIEEALAELTALGHVLHVATSKAAVFAVRIIDHFGLDKYFVSVNGSELDGTRADKGELISHILEHQAIDPTDAGMIGDRKHDMIGAARNGIPGIGVLWGYGNGAELMDAGAKACVRVPTLLAGALEGLK